MGLIDKAGKKALLRLPKLKLISLSREIMPDISVEAEGLTFFFKNTDHSILDDMVVSGRVWSGDDMDYILGYFDSISSRPGTIIDIGANVGTSVIYFRNRLGSDTVFYAVEPVTDNYNLLNANCAVNGFSDIHTYRLGLSDHNGKTEMEINPSNMATCRISGSDKEHIVFPEDETAYVGDNVPVMTLDAFISQNKISGELPVLFWIDVEGYEPEVFSGGKKTFLDNDSVVYCEYNPKLYKFNGKYDMFLRDIKDCFGRFICFEQSEKDKYAFRDISEIDKVADENGMNQCNLLLIK